jgi:hypothetical protein
MGICRVLTSSRWTETRPFQASIDTPLLIQGKSSFVPSVSALRLREDVHVFITVTKIVPGLAHRPGIFGISGSKDPAVSL